MTVAVLFGYVVFDVENFWQTEPLIVVLTLGAVDDKFEQSIATHFVSYALEGKHLWENGSPDIEPSILGLGVQAAAE